MAETMVKLLIVLPLVMSASDAARPLKDEEVAAATAPWAGTAALSTNGRLVSVNRIVVSKASAGHSGCTYDSNNSGRRCPC
jgi:hypothetical protein